MAFERGCVAGFAGILFGALALLTPATAQLPIEPTPNVGSLPAEYPDSWAFLIDPNFFGIESGKVVIVDVGAENHQHKGAISLAQFGFFAEAKTRPELYAVETFYSRGSRGERTDVLTIYDKSTLTAVDEIVLPQGKRAQVLTEKGAFQLSHDERFAYLFNFTPASSVTVIDLVNRRVVGDIDIPGCVHAFALGGGGFASLCGNGVVVSTHLDENGALVSQTMSEPFQDIDEDPMFTRAAIANGVAYFPTYNGRIQPIDLSGDVAIAGEAWTIETADEESGGRLFGLLKSKEEDDRLPSGWQLITSDDADRLYILMRKNATPDDHDSGGDEIWVVDPETHRRVQRIELDAPSQIIEVTRGENPYLIAVMPDMSLNIYEARTGDFVRRIGGQIVMTPFAIFAAN